jgi:hypothetical protein
MESDNKYCPPAGDAKWPVLDSSGMPLSGLPTVTAHTWYEANEKVRKEWGPEFKAAPLGYKIPEQATPSRPQVPPTITTNIKKAMRGRIVLDITFLPDNDLSDEATLRLVRWRLGVAPLPFKYSLSMTRDENE